MVINWLSSDGSWIGLRGVAFTADLGSLDMLWRSLLQSCFWNALPRSPEVSASHACPRTTRRMPSVFSLAMLSPLKIVRVVKKASHKNILVDTILSYNEFLDTQVIRGSVSAEMAPKYANDSSDITLVPYSRYVTWALEFPLVFGRAFYSNVVASYTKLTQGFSFKFLDTSHEISKPFLTNSISMLRTQRYRHLLDLADSTLWPSYHEWRAFNTCYAPATTMGHNRLWLKPHFGWQARRSCKLTTTTRALAFSISAKVTTKPLLNVLFEADFVNRFSWPNILALSSLCMLACA